MGEQKFLTEGILNQFGKSICGDIPLLLANMCEKYFNVEDATSKIVSDHLIERIYLADNTYYEQIKTPGRAVIRKLDRKKQYQLSRLLLELQTDYEAVKSGNDVTTTTSPYNKFALEIIRDAAGLTKEESINVVFSKIDTFRNIMKQTPGKKSNYSEEFHGFYEYPYFTLIEMNSQKKAERLLRIDLENFVLHCATLPKYQQYVSYPADSASRGFYGEVIRSKKEDTEYEIITSQYLQNKFFPDEHDITHVKIMSPKPWDLKDMNLFGYLCNRGITSVLKPSANGKPKMLVEGTIRDLCKAISPEATSFSSKSYALARARLSNMIDTKLAAVTADGDEITQVLFDRVRVKKHTQSENSSPEAQKEGGIYQIRLGLSLTEDILSHRLSAIIKPKIAELKNSAAIIMYAPLKKDRAVDLCLYKLESHEYSLITLLFMYRLDARKKATRIEKFSEIFNEFKNKGVLIKDFSVVDSKFIIEWIPLSTEEKNDIRVLTKEPDDIIDTSVIEAESFREI